MSRDPHLKLYRGRLAPSPTGLLHLGHARTFWIAARRAAEHGGQLILRNEDLDSQRCRPEFVQAMLEDLRWLGIEWVEGPDCGGPVGPYTQSERRGHYLQAWRKLRDLGMIYPCTCSRKDVAQAAGAPNDADDEPVYPGRCWPLVSGAAWLRLRETAAAAVATCAVETPGQYGGMAVTFQLFWIDPESHEKHEHNHADLTQRTQESQARGGKQVRGELRREPSQQRRSEHDSGEHLAHHAGLLDLQENGSNQPAHRQHDRNLQNQREHVWH